MKSYKIILAYITLVISCLNCYFCFLSFQSMNNSEILFVYIWKICNDISYLFFLKIGTYNLNIKKHISFFTMIFMITFGWLNALVTYYFNINDKIHQGYYYGVSIFLFSLHLLVSTKLVKKFQKNDFIAIK